jgi:hypothetical protein
MLLLPYRIYQFLHEAVSTQAGATPGIKHVALNTPENELQGRNKPALRH